MTFSQIVKEYDIPRCDLPHFFKKKTVFYPILRLLILKSRYFVREDVHQCLPQCSDVGLQEPRGLERELSVEKTEEMWDEIWNLP